MRVTQHNLASWPAVRCLCLAVSLLMTLALAGCSAANMTGFEFPVFGLTKKSAEEGNAPQTGTQSDANPAYYGAGEQPLTNQ